MSPSTAFCGLDFGTSNSTAGLWHKGVPRLVALEDGKPTLPSAVFFPFESPGTVHVGRKAIQTYIEGENGRFMRALKSVLGTSLIQESTHIGRKHVSFQSILGCFLGRIKTRIEAVAGQDVSAVVLGRPVFFVDDDPIADATAQNELEAIAHTQGFRHIQFQFEPIAAALDYESRVQQEETVLVVDIGGGTSDFSIVRVSPHAAQKAERQGDILANTGVHIGGTDFDKLLSMARIMPHLGYNMPVKSGVNAMPSWHYFNLATWQRINQLYERGIPSELRQMRFDATEPEKIDRLSYVVSHRLGHALAGQVETAKIALTDTPETILNAPFGPEPFPILLTQEHLNTAISESTARIAVAAQEALTQAHLPAAKLNAVFLTGGASQVPYVRQTLLACFPQAKVVEGDMFGSVGLGLTHTAARMFGECVS